MLMFHLEEDLRPVGVKTQAWISAAALEGFRCQENSFAVLYLTSHQNVETGNAD